MKNIKFRTWDKGRKEYLSGGNVFISINPGIRPETSNIYLDMIDKPDMYKERFDIEQYTGLKDCIGIEIFEGDIVRFNAIAPMSYVPDGFIGKVEFMECGFFVTYGNQGFYLFDECHEWKVIGNIHKNPNMLDNK